MLLTQPPSAICSAISASTSAAARAASKGGERCNDCTCATSKASRTMPPSRCAVTTAGYSLSVTVYLPNSPCTSTQASAASAHSGARSWVARARHSTTLSPRISAPTAIAR